MTRVRLIRGGHSRPSDDGRIRYVPNDEFDVNDDELRSLGDRVVIVDGIVEASVLTGAQNDVEKPADDSSKARLAGWTKAMSGTAVDANDLVMKVKSVEEIDAIRAIEVRGKNRKGVLSVIDGCRAALAAKAAK